MRRKAAELTEEQARRRHAPSSTTAAGLLKHLALVEHNWFVRVLGQPPSVLPGPEISFAVGEEETVAGLITAHEAASARSRESTAGYPLDHVVPHEWPGSTATG
ncbi:mycothiol transferase [Streptomyces albidoflavus]|uniref:mycothiol transferase n=1 Tax=Streptomyces albidoflavus TaxID=1886 RepID=UPI0038D0D846